MAGPSGRPFFSYFYRMKFLWVTLCAGLLFACKKGASFDDTATFTASVLAQANDQVRISTTIDAAFNDVDSVLANPVNLCGANVTVDSVDSPRSITITYTGATCGVLLYHAGTITVQYPPGNNWDSTLDTVAVLFTNVTINTPPDTTNILFNGLCYYTNVTGASLSTLTGGSASSIVHTITGVNLNVIFDYAWPQMWQIARQRTYTNNNGIVISTAGMDTVGGIPAVSEWGGNRFGNSVITAIDSPLVADQGCGWQTTAGQIMLNNPSGMTSMTYGLDSTGAATGCPVAGRPYYYKLAWTGTGQDPVMAILPYP